MARPAQPRSEPPTEPDAAAGPRRRPRRAAPGLDQLPVAPAGQPVPPGRDPVRRPGRGDPRAPRSGSSPRSASRSSATGRSTPSRRPARRSTAPTRRVRLDPAHVEALIATAPVEFELHARNPERNVDFGGAEPRLRRGRRPGLRHRPRPRPARRQLRRLRRLRPAHRRARRHPPGGRRPARAERPAGRDPPPRHVPDVRGRARQDLAVPRASGRDRSTTRSRSSASSAASTATRSCASRSLMTDHQHQLAAPPRRPDGRRADRDGARTASRSSPRRSRWPGR